MNEATSKPDRCGPATLCEWCRKEYRQPRKKATTRFCSKSCSALWRTTHQPDHSKMEKMVRAATLAKTGRPRPDASERMKRLNADPVFRAKADAASRSRKGQTWLGKRGGNGFLTEPQKALCAALGLPDTAMELTVLTAPVKEKFPSLPHHYKVDIGIADIKLAIEVDGNSHNTKRWRFLDARKTKILSALGWSVLRFKNAEVLADLPSITSKLKTHITTLRTASS